MLILDLVINDEAIDKLAARGILRIEVEQVIANGPTVGDNPSPRIAGSKLAVGPTDAARFSLVLQPDADSATRWHLMTAWESSTRQVALFHHGR